MATQTTVQVELTRSSKPSRTIRCPFGCEYSANVHDYFWARAGHAFTCEHGGERIPCELAERVYIAGEDSDGRTFYGSAWLTIKEACTVDDLTDD